MELFDTRVRLLAVVLAAVLTAPVLADTPNDRPAQIPETASLDLSKSYEAFNNFEQVCGTKAQFKTDKCYALHKKTMRDFWQTVAGE